MGMATTRAREGAQGAPPSHYRRMQTMFALFLRSSAGRGLASGARGMRAEGWDELYAVYCAGYTEGVWTERAQRGKRKEAGSARYGDGD